MKVKQPDFAAVMSLVWRQAPALLVLSFLANLLLFSTVYGLQVYDRVLPSGVLDTLVWLTVATLVAIHHHHFSPQAGSKRSGFSISPR
jgi:ATP-binding cassette, subfamily C, type I secretion system permease/ATPase